MASDLKTLVAEARLHHTFFLEEGIARQLAREKNLILPDYGEPELQMCYFPSSVNEIIDENLIGLNPNEIISFFWENDFPTPTFLLIPPEAGVEAAVEELRSSFWSTIDVAKRNRAKTPEHLEQPKASAQKNTTHNDAYFLEEKAAAEVAKLNNRVQLGHPSITGLQICYFDGIASEGYPPNLIGVKLEDCYEYFLETRNRLPTTFVASRETPEELGHIFKETMRAVAIARQASAEKMREWRASTPLTFDEHEPLRIFLPANRLTEVMQYASKNIGKAFQTLGHKVMISVEENDMESLHEMHHIQAHNEFQPHIVFTINHLEESLPMSDHTFNVVWWHDFMPKLEKQTQFEVRDRDFAYSAAKQLDPLIKECGFPDVQRQGFCVDTTQFFEDSRLPREDKIVFVGSSYISRLYETSQNFTNALFEIKEAFEAGVTLDERFLRPIAEKYKVSYEYVFWDLLHFVVRDISVEWLCDASPLPVEIYGTGWQKNPKVRKFHKGYIAHGEDLASLYRTSKYALVTHPFEINSQRLAEVCASGSIPIVYNCTHSSYEPHWREELTFYKTKAELIECLEKQLGRPAPKIGEYFSYLNFAKRIIAQVRSHHEKLR